MKVWNSNYKAQQGNIGLGRAIAYFTSIGIPTSIPLNDTQKYDLVVDFDGVLKKVSVKTTSFLSKSKWYSVLLKKCGGSSGNAKIKPFDNKTCDLLFVLTMDDTMYLIPSNEIYATTSLVLNDRFDKYQINMYKTSALLEKEEVESP